MGKTLIIKEADFRQNGMYETVVYDRTIIASELSWTSGGYIKASNGTAASLSAFSYSNTITVTEGYINLEISHCWTNGGAFYDANMSYIGGIATNSDTLTPTTHAIPSGTKFVRVNCKNTYLSSFYITLKP